MSVSILFVTHAEVEISPVVPVPDWPLSDRGRARHLRHAEALRADPPDALFCSTERKARDAAAILSEVLGCPVTEDARLGENDRSATGYLPPPEFAKAVDAFFGEPDQSFRGWETARAAQARIVGALADIAAGAGDGARLAIVAHGGVGALLLAHVSGQPISCALDQPGAGGGNTFRFTWPDRVLDHDWRPIDRD